jgi:hypothetical protein
MSNSQEYMICNLFRFTFNNLFYKAQAKIVNKMLNLTQHCNIYDGYALHYHKV